VVSCPLSVGIRSFRLLLQPLSLSLGGVLLAVGSSVPVCAYKNGG